MSHEYFLTFEEASASQQFIDTIRQSPMACIVDDQETTLKDQNPSDWSYDYRLIRESATQIYLEIAMPSKDIDAWLLSLLLNQQVTCTEPDDDDAIPLRDVLRRA